MSAFFIIPHRLLFSLLFFNSSIFNLFLFLALLGLHCCMWAFSSFHKSGLLSSCDAWASHWGGFSCCRAQALGAWASVIAARGLSSWGSWALEHGVSSYGSRVTPQHAESSLTRDRTHVPWFGMGSLIHCTTQGIPAIPYCLLNYYTS